MEARYWLLALALASSCGVIATAQNRPPASAPTAEPKARHEPPLQAYEDCKGKKAGDAIQHTTPEGRVEATCQESPKGLVARPKQPKGSQPDMGVK